MKKIRKRITYANVMSSIAVFLVLGGASAYAAKKIGSNEIKGNSITTGKIKKEAVSASKIKKNSVVTAKIADNAVTTAKIANGAVTGAKLNLGTVGTVPNAAHANSADNANTVNGQKVVKIAYRVPDNSGTQTIFNSNGLAIAGTCTGGNVELNATTTKNDSSIYTVSVDDDTANTVLVENLESGEFDVGSNFDLLAGGDGNTNVVTFEYDATDGTVATGTLAVDTDGALGGCRATGDVTVG